MNNSGPTADPSGASHSLQRPDVAIAEGQPARNLPIGFPRPEVHNSTVRRVQLNGNLHDVLETITGNFYEFGRTLKQAIYGFVVHAMAVTKNPDSSYTRTQPLRQFAIKIYTRQKLRELRGNTQENPFMEIAALQYLGRHPGVVSQVECCGDSQNLYSIMEFCDGTELYGKFTDS